MTLLRSAKPIDFVVAAAALAAAVALAVGGKSSWAGVTAVLLVPFVIGAFRDAR